MATTLIALGMAGWPLSRHIEMNSGFEEFLVAACLVSFFALPGAGVGCLFGRVLTGVIAGLALGVVLVYVIT